MINCCECDYQFTDSTKGRHKCPNCYSDLIITHTSLGEVSVRTITIQRPKVEKDRRTLGKVIEKVLIDTYELGSILCRVCKITLHNQDEGRQHKLGILCNGCYSKQPKQCECKDCLNPLTILPGYVMVCPYCESTNVVEKAYLPQDWEKHILPTNETYTKSVRVVYGDERDMVSDGSYLHGSSLHQSSRIVTKATRKSERVDTSSSKRYNKPGVVVEEIEIPNTPKLKFRKA